MCDHCCSGKINMYYIFWVCVCSSWFPACKYPYVIWSSVACLAVQYFTHLINGILVEKNYWTWNVWFDFLDTFFLKHYAVCEELSEIWTKLHICLHVKDPLFLSDFNERWIFSTHIRKIRIYQIWWKSVHWEASSTRTNRHDEANSLFSQFCEHA